MAPKNPLNKFAKFLSYVLGRKPDEFGLLPDDQGYVKIKDLIKAFNEEEGWRHIRMAHINELMVTLPNSPVEIKDNLIRAADRENVPKLTTCKNPPKLLYGCVRTKAYPFVFQRGFSPSASEYVILSANQDMALRMGRRIDQNPVLLTVQVQNCLDNGMMFYEFGSLYLTGFVPVDCFTGPPLPKQKEEKPAREKPPERRIDPLAGSFFMDLNTADKEKPYKKKKRGNEPAWKQDRRRARKEKNRF